MSNRKGVGHSVRKAAGVHVLEQTIIIMMFSASAALESPKSVVITPVDCKEAKKVFGRVVI